MLLVNRLSQFKDDLKILHQQYTRLIKLEHQIFIVDSNYRKPIKVYQLISLREFLYIKLAN